MCRWSVRLKRWTRSFCCTVRSVFSRFSYRWGVQIYISGRSRPTCEHGPIFRVPRTTIICWSVAPLSVYCLDISSSAVHTNRVRYERSFSRPFWETAKCLFRLYRFTYAVVSELSWSNIRTIFISSWWLLKYIFHKMNILIYIIRWVIFIKSLVSLRSVLVMQSEVNLSLRLRGHVRPIFEYQRSCS